MTEKTTCPDCGKDYKSIGSHWRYNPDHRVSFTPEQKDIIEGVLAADGTLCNRSITPYIQCDMVRREYLEHLDSKFPVVGRGVVMSQTSEGAAESARDSGFSPEAQSENYSNVYRWRTVTHTDFEEYIDWYENGKKVWASADFSLTPTTLKHLFCGDGHYDGSRISISSSNLSPEKKEEVEKKFDSINMPVSSIYDQRVSDVCVKQNIIFTEEVSDELFGYMGSPPPGFEYKWPDRKI